MAWSMLCTFNPDHGQGRFILPSIRDEHCRSIRCPPGPFKMEREGRFFGSLWAKIRGQLRVRALLAQKQRRQCSSHVPFGGPGRVRTYDQPVMSRSLCH